MVGATAAAAFVEDAGGVALEDAVKAAGLGEAAAVVLVVGAAEAGVLMEGDAWGLVDAGGVAALAGDCAAGAAEEAADEVGAD